MSLLTRGGKVAWRRNEWRPVYIRLSLQLSLTLACIKALSKTFPNIHGCLRSESSYYTSKHTCCSPACRTWMVYSYKASAASTYLKKLCCIRQSPIICTHAWPSCHFNLSTYNNLTLSHIGNFLGRIPMPEPLKVHIVRTDISAISLMATARHEPVKPLAYHLWRVPEFLGLWTCRKIPCLAVKVGSRLVGVSFHYPFLICPW